MSEQPPHRYVLGMAKRYLDLKGSKARNLELDLLRLVWAVGRLQGGGSEAHGYQVVATADIRHRALAWLDRYQGLDLVSVEVAPLTPGEHQQIVEEIDSCRTGVLAAMQGQPGAELCDARTGGDVVERHLRKIVDLAEPGFVHGGGDGPFGIRWDLHGRAPAIE